MAFASDQKHSEPAPHILPVATISIVALLVASKCECHKGGPHFSRPGASLSDCPGVLVRFSVSRPVVVLVFWNPSVRSQGHPLSRCPSPAPRLPVCFVSVFDRPGVLVCLCLVHGLCLSRPFDMLHISKLLSPSIVADRMARCADVQFLASRSGVSVGSSSCMTHGNVDSSTSRNSSTASTAMSVHNQSISQTSSTRVRVKRMRSSTCDSRHSLPLFRNFRLYDWAVQCAIGSQHF